MSSACKVSLVDCERARRPSRMGETPKKERNITWQPYLPNDAKQDILEIYERLDVDRQGFITQQRLHAALNEAYGKPIRAETVRPLAARMDITSRHGLKVSHNDFMEYMAQKLLSAESYEDLLRSEQGLLMQEVGYKVYELLERFKRKQMLKDAMAGGDGIQRLLHLTTVPMANRNRRKGQSGTDLHTEAGAKGAKGGAGSSGRGKPRAGAGPGVTGVEGGAASRAVGDTSVVSRSSLVSRYSSGGVVEMSTSSPAAVAAAGMRAGNSRSAGGGRPPCGRPSRNSAPAAARASSALASLLGRAEGHDPDIGPGLGAVEDRGSVQRWRKSTSHFAEELQLQHQPQYSGSLPGPTVDQPQIHAREQQQQQQQLGEAGVTGHVVGGPVTLTVIRPRSSNPSAPSSHLSSQITNPSQPGSPQLAPGLLSLGLAPASGDGGVGMWPSRRLAPHTASLVASAQATTLPNPFSRNAAATPSIAVPSRGGGSGGGSGSRASSPAGMALGPLGFAIGAGGQPLSASPLGGARAEGWRSAALMAQVLEAERLDLHSQVLEDLRATVGLSISPSPSWGQLKSHHQQHLHQQQQQLLLQGQGAHQHQQQQQQHPFLQLLSSSIPLQQQHIATAPASTPLAQSGLQLRSHSFPRQSSILEEEAKGMDAPAAGSSAEFYEGEMGPVGKYQRAEPHTHVSQPPPSPHLLLKQQQQQQRQSATRRHSQTQPPQARRSHSQPAPPPQQQSQPHHGSNAERRREGDPVGTWVTSDPDGVLGQLLRGSLSSGGQPRNGRPRFQAVSAPDALRLDVSGPIESDPLLAKLPDWVRKGIGLPPAPGVQPVEPEPGAQHVAVAPEEPSPLTLTAPANEETEAEDDAVGDGGGDNRQQVKGSSRGVCDGALQEERLGGGDAGAGSGEPPGAVDGGGGGGGAPRLAAMRGYSLRHSMTRFLPFGGDVAAVVAEEENEEQNSETPPQAVAMGNDGSGGDGPAAPPAPPAAVVPALAERQQLAARNGERAAAAPSHIQDPRVGDASHQAAVIEHGPGSTWVPPTAVEHQPELLTPGPFAYGKNMSTWPTGGAADRAVTGDGRTVDGNNPDAAAAAEDWQLHREVELATRESLTAWEAAVLSRRSSVGHGSLHGMVQQGEGEEEEEGGRNSEPEDEEAMAIYKELTGNSGISVARRASMGELLEHPASALLHHMHHHHSRHPNLHAHWEQQEPQLPPRREEPEPLTQMRTPLAGQGESEGSDGTKSSFDVDNAVEAKDRQGGDVGHGDNSQDTSLGRDYTATLEASGCSGGGSGGHPPLRRPASQPFPQPTKPQRPPFYMGSRPRSAALLPSVAAVVAAAEAAAAEAAAASYMRDIGSGGLWSADYVGEGVAASGRPPAVRLNHTAMLRLQAQYGSELVASAGAALGLGGSSAAARDVASRELLQTLTANGSCRVPPLSPSLSTARDGASGAYVPAAAGAAQSQRRRRSSSNHGAAAADGTLQSWTSGGGTAFLPHDAIGLGRQISRQASRRVSSESGAGSSGARPTSARAAAPSGGAAASAAAAAHGPIRRPASALPPRNPASQHATGLPTSNAAGALPAPGPARARSQQAPTSSHPDPGRAFAQATAIAAAAVGQVPPAWSGANRRPPGRSASALAPTSHLPPTISIGRVRQLEHSEVSSCFTTLPVASSGGAGSATAATAAASEGSGARARNAARPSQLPSPGSPASPTVSVVALGCLASGPPRSPALKEGSVGGASAGRRTASAGSSSSGGRGHSGMAAADGSGAGEERRRRTLEVMGTGALTRKGSAGSGIAVAGSGEAVAGGPRIVGTVARAR